MSEGLFPITFILFSEAIATQLIARPSFTPCTFPSPLHQPILYRHFCERFPSLPFICDLHESIHGPRRRSIEEAFKRYQHVFIQNNRTNIGLIIAKNVEQPWRHSEVLERDELRCLFTNDCSEIDDELINGFVTNARTFLRVWTWKVYERWFEVEDSCQLPNVLVFILVDGIQNDPRKMPYVTIYSGSKRLHAQLRNIEAETYNALVQNWEMSRILTHLLDDIGYQMKEYYSLNGEMRDHSVPYWAKHLFIGCFGLVVVSLIVEWYIVRRKLAIRKSASGIKIASVKSKTHLMF